MFSVSTESMLQLSAIDKDLFSACFADTRKVKKNCYRKLVIIAHLSEIPKTQILISESNICF